MGAPNEELSTILKITNVSKAFGATKAVRDFSFDFLGNKTYALVGENGSGKSTLTKIVSGVLPPDTGMIEVNGHAIRRFSPRGAIKYGIATCFQEVLVEDNLSVLDNIFLWENGWIRQESSRQSQILLARSVLEALSPNSPDIEKQVEYLSLSAKQLVVIARALVQNNSSILLFDEATASLDKRDSERFLGTLSNRVSHRSTAIFTSHRLEEVEQFADEIVVLRDGQVAGVMAQSEFSEGRLLRLMSSVDRPSILSNGVSSRSSQSVNTGNVVTSKTIGDGLLGIGSDNEVVLRLRKVAVSADSLPVDVDINCGEITGLSGLDGQGQVEILQYMAGIKRPAMGTVEVVNADGSFAAIPGHRSAVNSGIVYVPRDRKTQGILPTRSVLDNFSLPTLSSRSRWGFSRARSSLEEYSVLADRLGIKSASWRSSITSLSGGNQQKVLVARWLAAKPRVLLLDDPTRGVDHTTKQDLYSLLRDLAKRGLAIVVISTELEEVVSLCDRVITVYNFAVSNDIRRSSDGVISRDQVLSGMFGRGSSK